MLTSTRGNFLSRLRSYVKAAPRAPGRSCIETQRRRGAAAGEREVTRTGSETALREARKKVLARCFHFHGNCPRPSFSLRNGITRISHESSALLVARGQAAFASY